MYLLLTGHSTHDEGGRFRSCHGQPGMYENGVKYSDTPDLIRQQGVQGQVWPITLQWMYVPRESEVVPLLSSLITNIRSPLPWIHHRDPIAVGHESKFRPTPSTLGEVNIRLVLR